MTITKEGSLASFYTVNKAPIKHLRVYFSPKQAGSGDPSPENVRTISGWNNIEFTHCGKNLSTAATGTEMVEKWPIVSGSASRILKFSNMQPGQEFTLSAFFTKAFQPSSNRRLYLTGSQAINSAANSVFSGPSADGPIGCIIHNWVHPDGHIQIAHNNRGLTYNADDIEYAASLQNIQLELGSTATEYEPYRGHTYNLDWSNDIGTIYGGYVDLVTGELVQEYNYYSFTGDETFHDQGNTWVSLYLPNIDTHSPVSSSPSVGICSHYPYNPYTRGSIGVMYNEKGCIFDGTIMNNIEWQQYCKEQYNLNTPVTICYKLKYPITHQLTPTQLQTLIGQNNIWSNADRVEIEYDLAESNDELYRRRNLLLRSYPSIKTASNSFTTDLSAPLKSAKIYFNPIQEGTGDPSPTNIRPITGWTGLSLYHSGDNLYVPNENNKGYINSSGVINVDNYSTYTDLIPVAVGSTYLFKCTTESVNGNTHRRIHGYNSEGTWVQQLGGGLTEPNTVKDFVATVTIPSDISYIRGSFRKQDLNVRIAKENVYEMDWSNDVGTVYGGYVDLIKGELVQEWQKIMLTENMNFWNNWGGNKLIYNASSMSEEYHGKRMAGTVIYSNILTPIGGTINPQEVTSKTEIRYYGVDVRYPQYFFVAKDENETIAEWRQWFSSTYPDAYVIYKLQIPIHYSLSPQTFKTLRGVNNIWSNSNGPISVQYWTH